MTNGVAWALAAFPLLATLVLTVELAAGQLGSRPMQGGGTPRVAIVIPAHDEAAIIADTVAALDADILPGTRLLVIADNCSDDTAAMASKAGAEVIERIDPALRGKGYALAFARDQLAAAAPDVVIVIDADCTISPGGPTRLAAAAQASGRPVQSTYLMRPHPEWGAMVGLSGFALLLRNLVRQRGLARIGAPALLTGSGMALPWDCFATAPLASGNLVEDLELGLMLTRAGRAPGFLPEVETWSEPARRAPTFAQRRRWEHGFLRTAFGSALPLIATMRWPGIWLGLHLLVPPLALLLIVDAVMIGLLAALTEQATSGLPIMALTGALTAVILLAALSWCRFGRAHVSPMQLLLLPFYILWKLPIYVTAIMRPERRWIRTGRS